MQDYPEHLRNLNQNISDKLGIEDEFNPITVQEEEINFDPDDPNQDLVNDYIFIRKKLRYSVHACEAVLESALRDMAVNPGARSVEGCSSIIKTITECTNQLLDLHGKRKKIFNIAEKEPEKTKEEKEEDNKNLKCKIDDIIDSFDEE